MASEYERMRENNIAENRRVLAELGLLGPYKDPFEKYVEKKRKPRTPRRVRSVNSTEENDENCSIERVYRRSERLLGKAPAESTVLLDEDDSDDDGNSNTLAKSVYRYRENCFGAIPDIPVGTTFETRLEFSRVGVHRPTVAGIHGNEAGCYSLALSGGYEDDLDLGECFTYTGEGGRDLKGTKSNPKNLRTAPQSKDQTLTRGNLALSKNVENRKPVRVIRGYKLNSEYKTDSGYRYDGLYTVEKYWPAQGKSGFLVYKYALKRCEDQEAAPWVLNKKMKASEDITDQTLDASNEHTVESSQNSNIVPSQESKLEETV